MAVTIVLVVAATAVLLLLLLLALLSSVVVVVVLLVLEGGWGGGCVGVCRGTVVLALSMLLVVGMLVFGYRFYCPYWWWMVLLVALLRLPSLLLSLMKQTH